MELLGALTNLFIIYVLLLFVLFEATERIIARDHVEKPFVMFITAVGGLIVNIVMYKVLHGADHHGHGLLADSCDHDHGEGGHHNHEPNNDLFTDNCTEEVCQDDDCNISIKEIHCHRGDSVHPHKKKLAPRKLPPINNGDSTDMIDQVQVRPAGGNEEVYCEEQHDHLPTCFLDMRREQVLRKGKQE
jgi:Co/Zn/Cd efflux system component